MSLMIPNHISFIMDGNGRWARSKNKPRFYGHDRGVKNISKILKYFLKNGIKNVSFFAFSTCNFARPKEEVDYLMQQIKINYNSSYIDSLIKDSIRFIWVGFTDNLDQDIISHLREIENKTKECIALNMYLFFNYSYSKEIEIALESQKMITKNIPQIDLLIRTSGEQRLSNYCMNLLLYSEIIFEKTLWPDYGIRNLKENLKEFSRRERRFGNVI